MDRLILVLSLLLGGLAGVLFDRLVLKDYWFSSADWGNVADWLGGVGTASAVGITAAQLLRDRRRGEKAERAFRESMARAVWASAPKVVKVDGGRHLQCVVENVSDLPVFELQVDFLGPSFKRNTRVGLLGGRKQVVVDSGAVLGLLVGGDAVALNLRFVDAYGNTWSSEGGQVNRLSGPPIEGATGIDA